MSIAELISRPISGLTEEQIAELIDDPAKIETHEVAREIILLLDSDIAGIQAQLDAAAMEANLRPLSPDRQAWAKRAAYAGAMRRNRRHHVIQRDKEIRGIKNPPNAEPKVSKEEKVLRQQRLLTEQSALKLKRENERLALQNERERIAEQRRAMQRQMNFTWSFEQVARERFPDLHRQVVEAMSVPLVPSA